MASLFRKGSDGLQNGTILGALFGAALVYGEGVYDWISTNLLSLLPDSATTFAGDFTLPLLMIAGGALIGYIVDRT